jgi:WD40 repeat protein
MRKEIGTLLHHNGTITSLAFVKKQHLITASDDGTIGIVRVHDWELLKQLKGHSKGVTCIDVHPSGTVLLSTGKDKTCRLWDLTKASMVSVVKLHYIPNKCKWSPQGDYYTLVYDLKIVLVETSTDERITIESKTRINSAAFATLDGKTVLVYGGEDKYIYIIDMKGESMKKWDSAHGLRIKDLAVNGDSLATCSSDGGIKIWSLSTEKLLAETDTKCRLTCITIIDLPKTRIPKADEKLEFPESDYEDLAPAASQGRVKVTFEKSGQDSTTKKSKELVQKLKRVQKNKVQKKTK